MPTKERVVGISGESTDTAYLRSALVDVDPVQIDIDGDPVVLWHESGQASALDAREISEGADLGTVGVFSPKVAGQELTFRRVGDGFTDDQTGSGWDVLGRATSGSLAGQSLQKVIHVDTFWFSWVLFHPDTDLLGRWRNACNPAGTVLFSKEHGRPSVGMPPREVATTTPTFA